MNITEMIISAIVKKGVISEGRNLNADFNIPMSKVGPDGEIVEKMVTVKVNVEHITIRLERKDEAE